MQELSRMDFEAKIISAMNAFVDQKEMFTSLDIINAVRQEVGPNWEITHDAVKAFIKDLYDAGDIDDFYKRTLIDVRSRDGTVRKAYLYHHADADITGYNSNQSSITRENLSKEPPGMIKKFLDMLHFKNIIK